MQELIHHLFIPRESNNHRARLLHHRILLSVIAFLFVTQFVIGFLKQNVPHVLGTTANFSINALLELTNQERQKEGLSQLTLNQELSKAAALKAQHMFLHNYWAHYSPEGTTPWEFFKQTGYDYRYAGENLARGFNTSEEVVEAWMESPTHRANMLSSRYEDIGFAVLDGRLRGEQTTLVVELFGTKSTATFARESSDREQPYVQLPEKRDVFSAVYEQRPLIDSAWVSTNLSIMVLLGFMFVLTLDLFVIKRKNIVRFVGHNLDHIIFLGSMLTFVLLFVKGLIL